MDNEKKILIVKIVSVLVSTVVATVIIIGIKNLIAPKEYYMTGLDVSEESYEEYLKSEMSDLEGKTKWEKRQMGLAPSDDSDTDGDGLTDKEEIEVYGTDPLKTSTAGDLYTDQYKIEHDMDPYTYYEYTEEIVFPYNQCPEIVLTPTHASDFNAGVNYYLIDKVDGYKVYKNYKISAYDGKLSIDLSELNDNIDTDKIVVLKGEWTGENFSEVEFNVQNNMVTLKDEIDSTNSTVIILAERQGFSLNHLKSTFSIDLDAAQNTAMGGIFDWCILGGFIGIKPEIYLDTGKILDIALWDGNKGHTINIIGYEITRTDMDNVKFYVWDNTSPKASSRSKAVIMVSRERRNYGYHDSFDFVYNAPWNWTIKSQQEGTGTTKYSFIIYDEQYNILDARYK